MIEKKEKKAFQAQMDNEIFPSEMGEIIQADEKCDQKKEFSTEKSEEIDYEKKESLFVDRNIKKSDTGNVSLIDDGKEDVFPEKKEGIFVRNKKASAPDNLPIFLPQEEAGDDMEMAKKEAKEAGFVSVSELEKEEKSPQEGDISGDLDKKEKEPSEEEVKERLNKLLRGEL